MEIILLSYCKRFSYLVKRHTSDLPCNYTEGHFNLSSLQLARLLITQHKPHMLLQALTFYLLVIKVFEIKCSTVMGFLKKPLKIII